MLQFNPKKVFLFKRLHHLYSMLSQLPCCQGYVSDYMYIVCSCVCGCVYLCVSICCHLIFADTSCDNMQMTSTLPTPCRIQHKLILNHLIDTNNMAAGNWASNHATELVMMYRTRTCTVHLSCKCDSNGGVREAIYTNYMCTNKWHTYYIDGCHGKNSSDWGNYKVSVIAHHSATIHSRCNVHSQDGGQTVCGIRGLYAGSCVRSTCAGPLSSTKSTDKLWQSYLNRKDIRTAGASGQGPVSITSSCSTGDGTGVGNHSVGTYTWCTVVSTGSVTWKTLCGAWGEKHTSHVDTKCHKRGEWHH